MGDSSYSFASRSARTKVYQTQSIAETFKQRSVHPTMDPKQALLRECRDSATHPCAVPIIIGLDVTGSMHHIPHHLIKDGLPTLISKLQEECIHDAAILFMAIGDSRCDRGPLQVGQFESGDSELDMWLTRAWLEGGGGGNNGESYGWAWWFAANRCVSDHVEKRKEKGFIFTIGDDDCHDISSSELSEVVGVGGHGLTKRELYTAASKNWNVYHINMRGRGTSGDSFRSFMGENLLEVDNETEIPALISRVVCSHTKPEYKQAAPVAVAEPEKGDADPGYTKPTVTL